MPVDYTGFAFPKGTPRVITERNRKSDAAAIERACRIAVDKRDGRKCFFPKCKQRAGEKHHILPRSRGGRWTTANIVSACTAHHRLFKAGAIRIEGNPDQGPVKTILTALGVKAKLKIPGA